MTLQSGENAAPEDCSAHRHGSNGQRGKDFRFLEYNDQHRQQKDEEGCTTGRHAEEYERKTHLAKRGRSLDSMRLPFREYDKEERTGDVAEAISRKERSRRCCAGEQSWAMQNKRGNAHAKADDC